MSGFVYKQFLGNGIPIYDKSNNPITMEEFGKLRSSNEYSIVDRRVITNRFTLKNYTVSTVWLGIDHRFGFGGKPLIFETMIFDEYGNSCYCDRTPTLYEATVAHGKGARIAEQYNWVTNAEEY